MSKIAASVVRDPLNKTTGHIYIVHKLCIHLVVHIVLVFVIKDNLVSGSTKYLQGQFPQIQVINYTIKFELK